MTTAQNDSGNTLERLLENGQEISHLLRHLGDNEIDSDSFAVTSECESYGTETEFEMSITDFACRAALTVNSLVEALEKYLHEAAVNHEAACSLNVENEELKRRITKLDNDCWIYESTVKKLLDRVEAAESNCAKAAQLLDSGERMARSRAVDLLRSTVLHDDADINIKQGVVE